MNTKSTASDNTNPVAPLQSRRSSAGKGIPNRDPSTQNRRNFRHIPFSGNMNCSRGIKKRILGEKSIIGESPEVLLFAELRSEFCAIGALEAHVCSGIGANSIAFCKASLGGFSTKFDDNSASFVTRDELILELERDVFTEDCRKVGMTERCCCYFDQKIPRPWLRDRNIFNLERLAGLELGDSKSRLP
jgi:hypothetical protein